jgi:hypothetical protein
MNSSRINWVIVMFLQILCVAGAFALREKAPKLSIACWVVFALLLVFKYAVMFRSQKRAPASFDGKGADAGADQKRPD